MPITLVSIYFQSDIREKLSCKLLPITSVVMANYIKITCLIITSLRKLPQRRHFEYKFNYFLTQKTVILMQCDVLGKEFLWKIIEGSRKMEQEMELSNVSV